MTCYDLHTADYGDETVRQVVAHIDLVKGIVVEYWWGREEASCTFCRVMNPWLSRLREA
jgi:hypothetical protein